MIRRVVTKPKSLPWHPGYPFKPRGGRARRLASGITLASLLSLIGGYYYVTNSERVRLLAQDYLTEVVGGPVHIDRARLSIFEGLRLEHVSIDADDKHAPDSHLLDAEALYVSFSLPSLLLGSLSDVNITAVGPRVLLVSDATGQSWNFQRLGHNSPATRPTPDKEPRKLSLPTVTLRNARIVKAELKDGKLIERGVYTVEGTLSPAPTANADPDRYDIAITARGGSNRRGPSFSGFAHLSTGQFSGRLQNFDLDSDVEAMLPTLVRNWWTRHEITGTFDIPELSFEPPRDGKPLSFRVRVRFDRGGAALDPNDLRSPQPPNAEHPTPPSDLPLVRFSNVRGELLFTDTGIELRQMALDYAGNVLAVSGQLHGYTPDSAFNLAVECPKLSIHEMPTFIPSLPKDAREVWDRFQPSGEGAFTVNLVRGLTGNLSVDGKLTVINGRMVFENFPLPAEAVTGEILLTTTRPGRTRLEVRNMTGRGPAGTVNEKARLAISGDMEPLEGGSRVDFTVRGEHLEADDALVAAMPEDARKTLALFALTNDKGQSRYYPDFGGSFLATIHRDEGRVSHWSWPIDITLQHGKARFEPFPYPLDNVTGRILIKSGVVELTDITARRTNLPTGDAAITVNGAVHYGDAAASLIEKTSHQTADPGRLFYDLAITAAKLPVDDALVNAIPDDKRQWMRRLGITGLLDAAGTVKGADAHYDLGLKLSRGAMRPSADDALARDFYASDLDASLRITNTSLTLEHASANRLQAPLTATGTITWTPSTTPGVTPEPARVSLDITAKGLSLDEPLRQALGTSERTAWDAVKPSGSADVTLAMRPNADTKLDITPLGLSVTPELLPIPLTDLRGSISIVGSRVTLTDLSARRDDCIINLAGTGSVRPGGLWDLSLGARNATFDAPLRDALPSTLKDTVSSLGLEGKTDIQFRRLAFTTGQALALDSATPPPTSNPKSQIPDPKSSSPGSDCDFDLSLFPSHLTVRLGVPVTVTSGEVRVSGAVRQAKLVDAKGLLNLQTGDIASRPFSNVHANIEKSPDVAGLRLDSLSGILADGELAGQAAIAFPEGQPTRYAMDLVLRNADVRIIGGPQAEAVSGRLSASIAIEGAVNDAASRKGRGDIAVTGDRMARVPVLLGLVQVANLSLPGDTSFNNATARYVLDGPLVTFDQLALRSPGLEMVGNGRIDLEARDVRLTLWTAPPDLPKIPLWSDLADRARRELLQVQVRGKIDDPKIGASSFDSFTTTVDEVLKSTGRTHGTTRK